jgi:hypothetical protein
MGPKHLESPRRCARVHTLAIAYGEPDRHELVYCSLDRGPRFLERVGEVVDVIAVGRRD